MVDYLAMIQVVNISEGCWCCASRLLEVVATQIPNEASGSLPTKVGVLLSYRET
jgi:hypothetical protein